MRHSWVFYDGSCGLCHWAVRFAALRDADGSRFRFAPLGGAAAGRELRDAVRRQLPDSVVVLTPAGEVILRSDAVVFLLRSLGGRWRILGGLVSLVPRSLRDLLYRLVAALRRRLLPPVDAPCPVVPENLRARFER